jgi:hypothetical protein
MSEPLIPSARAAARQVIADDLRLHGPRARWKGPVVRVDEDGRIIVDLPGSDGVPRGPLIVLVGVAIGIILLVVTVIVLARPLGPAPVSGLIGGAGSTPSPSPSASPSASPSPSATASPSPTASATPTASPTPTATPLIANPEADFLTDLFGPIGAPDYAIPDQRGDFFGENNPVSRQGPPETDIVVLGGATVTFDAQQVERITGTFPCGGTGESTLGLTWRIYCRDAAAALEPGPHLVVAAEMAEIIPEAHPTHALFYFVAIDTDGDPATSRPATAPRDPFQETDLWIYANYTAPWAPGGGQWQVRAFAPLASGDATVPPTDARVVMLGRVALFVIPASAFADPAAGYRAVTLDFVQEDDNAQGAFPIDVAPGGAEPPFPLKRPLQLGAEEDNADLRSFVEALADARSSGETDLLLRWLHPLVIDRYGSEACRRHMDDVVEPGLAYAVLEVLPPEPWEYASDGQSVTVPDTTSVRALHVVGEQVTEAELHFAFAGGSWRWFTDCGEPLG